MEESIEAQKDEQKQAKNSSFRLSTASVRNPSNLSSNHTIILTSYIWQPGEHAKDADISNDANKVLK